MISDPRVTTEALRLTAANMRDAVLAFAETSTSDDVMRWWQGAKAGFEQFETDDAPLSELREWVQLALDALAKAFTSTDNDAFAGLERQLVNLASRASELLVSLQSDSDAMNTADAAVQATAQWLSDTLVRSLMGEP
ncbi:MAG: hypothetical protein ACI81R_001487 [Bradymonadia bacterium]|jgi:hypothetical protein